MHHRLTKELKLTTLMFETFNQLKLFYERENEC